MGKTYRYDKDYTTESKFKREEVSRFRQPQPEELTAFYNKRYTRNDNESYLFMNTAEYKRAKADQYVHIWFFEKGSHVLSLYTMQAKSTIEYLIEKGKRDDHHKDIHQDAYVIKDNYTRNIWLERFQYRG